MARAAESAGSAAETAAAAIAATPTTAAAPGIGRDRSAKQTDDSKNRGSQCKGPASRSHRERCHNLIAFMFV